MISSGGDSIYKIFFLTIFLILFIFEPEKPIFLDKSILSNLSLLYLFGMILHLFIQNKYQRNWFRIDILFLVSILITYYIVPILFSYTGFFPDFHVYKGRYLYYVNYGTWLVTIGMYAWFIGFHFIRSRTAANQTNLIDNYSYNYNKLLILSWLLFILFISTVGSEFLQGNYEDTGNWSSIATYAYSLFSISILILTFFVLINNKDELKKSLFFLFKLNIFYLILISIYIFIFLFIAGDRGSAILLFSAILFTYGSFIKPINLKQLSILLLGGIFIMTLVSLGRNTGESILTKGWENFQQQQQNSQSQVFLMTNDLASTPRILYKTLEHVPKEHDYFLGKTMIGHPMSVVPFLQSLFLKLVDIDIVEMGTSTYMTHLVLGDFPRWGEGSSLFADIYINFGVYGVIVLMFILGMFFKKMNNEIISKHNLTFVVMAVILMSVSIYWPRSDYLTPIKPLVWSSIIIFLFIKLNGVKK